MEGERLNSFLIFLSKTNSSIVADHRFSVQPNDSDDGCTAHSHADFAAYDERSRDQERNGKSEH